MQLAEEHWFVFQNIRIVRETKHISQAPFSYNRAACTPEKPTPFGRRPDAFLRRKIPAII
jgi:hypothetical protein